ncbi:MAG: hypothetical protein Q8P67_17645, partial [archaeon]|nr:hypothetical protein [archaeon]
KNACTIFEVYAVNADRKRPKKKKKRGLVGPKNYFLRFRTLYFLHPEGPAARLSACHVSFDEWLSLRLAPLGEPFFKEGAAESSVLSILVAFFPRSKIP